MTVGKAHQRIIRERNAACGTKPQFSLFSCSPPCDPDIKSAVVRPISYETAEKIILEYEWLGTMGTTQYHYGIYFGEWCAGVVCFGYFQAMQGYASVVGKKYEKRGIQLTRGACVHWAHPHTGSKLISESLKYIRDMDYKFVVAFSDPDAGEIGTIYQATNWHYIGFDEHSPHYDLYYKSGKLFMNDRDIAKKYGYCGLKKLQNFISDKPDLVIKKRTTKGRYVYLLGSNKEKREIMAVLKSYIQPYPKRDNEGGAVMAATVRAR